MNDNEHPFTPAALAKTTATANRAATVLPHGGDPRRPRSRPASQPGR